MLRYPCLVLDHDDTVVQSEKAIHFPCFQYALKIMRPGMTIRFEDYLADCSTLGFVEMCRTRFGFTQQDMDAEFEMWKEYIQSHIPPPFPGVGRILQRQRSLGGRICVVSQSSEEIIRRDYAAHFGLQPDAVYGWSLPEEQRKPSPWPLLSIMQTFGFQPEELLVVDDLGPACGMAAAAGVQAGFARWGREEDPALCGRLSQLYGLTFRRPGDLEAFLFGKPPCES